jgi:hypothetical protein
MGSRKAKSVQPESHTRHKRVMRGLVDKLYRYPDEYDAHPLATEKAIEALIANVEVNVPRQWRPEGTGGGELFRAFALLVLDSIRSQLSQGVRTAKKEPALRTSQTKASVLNLLTSEQKRRIIGLTLIWFKHIWPALQQGRAAGGPPSYGEVINQCRSLDTLAGLLEYIPPFDERPTSEFMWLADAFTGLHHQGDSGTRRAGNHVDEALSFLLWRIEQAGNHLHLKITELLPELAEADSCRTCSAADVTSDWATRLARCVADYRAYELQQIEALLTKQGLSPAFDWFIPRQVSLAEAVPGNQPARIVSLADICGVETRIALQAHRGNGTTAALLWLSNQYCMNIVGIEPIVLRLDAREYIRYAINESPVSFLARQIYGASRASLAQRQEFEDVLGKAEAICLVDNSAWLPLEDQIQIDRRLSSLTGVVFTVRPETSSEDLMRIDGGDTLWAALAPFNEPQVQEFISDFAARCNSDVDVTLAQQIAKREFPGSASSPLWLSIICEQVRLRQASASCVVARLLDELFRREEHPLSRWHQEFSSLLPSLKTWFGLDSQAVQS